MSETQTPTRTPRWRRWLIEILIVVAVVSGVHLYQTRDAARGPAPPLSGAGLNGEALSLEALRGRTVLVQFWATWCPVCRVQEGSIQALSEDWPVLSVALEDTPPEALRAYMNKEGLNFPVLRDTDGALGARYGVRGTPTAFIVDPTGQIRFTEVGYTTGWGLRLRLWWADNVGSPPSPEPVP